MLKSLHFIYNGFSEYEVALACSMLASKGELYTASLDREDVRGEGGFTLRPDLNFNDLNAADFDILVISGMLDAKPYWEAMSLFAKIAKFNSDGKVIAAICGGPLFLGKRASCAASDTLAGFHSKVETKSAYSAALNLWIRMS